MITITATASATRVETTARGVLVLQLTVDETDPYLSLVSASVGWGDGQVEDFPLQAKPLGPLTLEHAYAPGTYYVSVVAFNAATPNPARAAWVAPFTVVLANQPLAPTSAPIIFGPIYPRFTGAPNPGEWEFDTATDGVCLEASLVSILFTNPGERLMLPDYGCGLSRLIFDPNDSALRANARELAAAALAKWEPRATLSDLQYVASGRDAALSFTFASNLGPQIFTLLVPVAGSPGS